jgi:hypothetical protein
MAARIRRTALPAALALAAVTLVGGCGDDEPTAEPLSLASRSTSNDMAAASAEGAGGGGDLTVSGTLPAGPGTAPIVRPSSPGRDSVTALAASLGLTGDVRELAGGWVAPSSADPSQPAVAPRLIVLKDGAGSWTYGTSTQCALDAVAADAASGCTESAVAVPAPDGTATDTPLPVPSACIGRGSVASLNEAELRAVAAPILAAVDLAAAPTTVEAVGTADARLVASPRVLDRPTSGIDTTIAAVDCSGAVVTDARGTLAAWTAGADYPVITADEGIERVRALPQPLMAELCRVPPDGTGCLSSTRTIVGAEFGFMRDIDLGDTSVVLAPAWIYEVRIETVDPDGGPAPADQTPSTGSLVVSAVADSALATATPFIPPVQASSDPGVPSEGGSGGSGVSTGSPGRGVDPVTPEVPPEMDVPERMGESPTE